MKQIDGGVYIDSVHYLQGSCLPLYERSTDPIFGLHIYCINQFFGLRRPLRIQLAIVIDLNLTVSPTRPPCTFMRNLKLSQDPTSRQFVACSLIHHLLVEVISLSFFFGVLVQYIIRTRETKVIEEIDCVGGVKNTRQSKVAVNCCCSYKLTGTR